MFKFVRYVFALLLLIKVINGGLYSSSSSEESSEVIRNRLKNRNVILPQPGECGVEEVITSDKSTNVVIGENPWQAFFISDTNAVYDCSGVLINERYVLTKGICLRYVIIQYVRLGDWNIHADPDCDASGICADSYANYEIEELVLEHKRPSRRRSLIAKSDAGLIRLNRNVIFTKWIKPICLPFSEDLLSMSYDTASFTVGAFRNSDKKITKAISTPISIQQCAAIWVSNLSETSVLSTAQFCANLTNVNVNDFNAPYAMHSDTLITGQRYKFIVGMMSYRYEYNNIYFGDRITHLYTFIKRHIYV